MFVKALKNGFNLSNNGEIIKLSKGNVTLTFDKVVRTKNGFVPKIKFLLVLDDVRTSVMETKKRDTIDVDNLHKILGHCDEVNARLTGKEYGYGITNKFDVCEACSVLNNFTLDPGLQLTFMESMVGNAYKRLSQLNALENSLIYNMNN
jgi:AAA+ ATPase superfamily predicted ATPase